MYLIVCSTHYVENVICIGCFRERNEKTIDAKGTLEDASVELVEAICTFHITPHTYIG